MSGKNCDVVTEWVEDNVLEGIGTTFRPRVFVDHPGCETRGNYNVTQQYGHSDPNLMVWHLHGIEEFVLDALELDPECLVLSIEDNTE